LVSGQNLCEKLQRSCGFEIDWRAGFAQVSIEVGLTSGNPPSSGLATERDEAMAKTFIRAAVCAFALAAIAGLAGNAGAQESVMKQCGDKWQAAKAAGQVQPGVTWPKFLSQCRAELSSQQTAPAPAPTPTVAPKPAPAPAPTQTTTAAPPTTMPPATGGTAGQHSRIKQCGAEWRANKATLQPQYGSWPKYWSACDKRMKAAGQ
jgi:hypothetical protein